MSGDSNVFADVLSHADGLTVVWDDAHQSFFHHVWLRDNCRCEGCYHPQTRERLVDAMSLPLDIVPASVESLPDGVRAVWPDGHVSRFPAAFLRTHCYAPSSRERRREVHRHWRGNDLADDPPRITYATAMADDAGLAAFCELLWSVGLVLVQAVPDTDTAVPDLCGRISWMRETNFGVDFEVIAEIEPNNVAYTAIELDHHTDLPNREMPPGVQFLHCRRADAPGGASTLVDGFAAAAMLAERDPEAYALLTSVEVPYVFHDDDYDIRWAAPVIGVRHDGTPRDIRHHNALMAPLDHEPDRVKATYTALQAYAATLREPGMALEYRMNPGEMMVFNNRRVLHGRRAFDPGGGKRHLHGAYVDIDELRSKMRVLARTSGNAP